MAKNGNGNETISISLPGNVLDLIDKSAGVLDLNRSKFIERAIKKYLLSNAVELSGMGHFDFWDKVYREVFNKS